MFYYFYTKVKCRIAEEKLPLGPWLGRNIAHLKLSVNWASLVVFTFWITKQLFVIRLIRGWFKNAIDSCSKTIQKKKCFKTFVCFFNFQIYSDEVVYIRRLTGSEKPPDEDPSDPDFNEFVEKSTPAKRIKLGSDFVRRSNRRQKVRGEKEFQVNSSMILRDLKVKVCFSKDHFCFHFTFF